VVTHDRHEKWEISPIVWRKGILPKNLKQLGSGSLLVKPPDDCKAVPEPLKG
jgi:hypothetical protein